VESKPVGVLVRDWRELRRFSQLQLATRCDISPKHLSYVETGKSRPSPEMIIHLCEHLDIPLRVRNQMLLTAGYAPRYADQRTDTAVDAEVQAIIDIVIESHPYPAAVVDHQWNIVAANSVSSVFTSRVAPHLLEPPFNLIRLSLHPDGLAPLIVNLDEYAHHILGRLRRLTTQQPNQTFTALLDEFEHLDNGGRTQVSNVVLPIVMRLNAGDVRLFSTITTFGTPHEVTLADLSIEMFYPADAKSKRLLNTEKARLKSEIVTKD
jgi:transcriptional regulator with XRE-family HTH domain